MKDSYSKEEIIEMLNKRFEEDEKGNEDLDYVSWELGFQRGMEWQKKLDKRVLDLTERAKGLIGGFFGN